MGRSLLCLAPMVNLTHPAFRELVAFLGGCDLYFTEMVNVRILKSFSLEKDPYLRPGFRDRPLWVQLVGRDPRDFRDVALKLKNLDYIEGLNLNLGCLKGSFQRFKWGAHLLKEPQLVSEILKALSYSEKPLSVKMRIPSPKIDPLLYGLFDVFEKNRISFVIIHARTPEDGFKRPARWSLLKDIAEFASFNIIANGDIFSPKDALTVLSFKGINRVMIGRAALIRPWIFRDIQSFIKTKIIPFPPELPKLVNLMAQFLKELLPKSWWCARFDAFLFWFFQNFDNALFYIKKAKKLRLFEDKVKFALEVVSKEKLRPYPIKPFLPF